MTALLIDMWPPQAIPCGLQMVDFISLEAETPGVWLSNCSLYFLYCHLSSSWMKFGSWRFDFLQRQWQRSPLNKSHALLSFWHCTSFTKAVWQVQGTNLLIPAPLDSCVWCSTLLEGLTNTSGTCFQSGGATWPGTSLDLESGVTVLVWCSVQANDSLLVQLIILSAGEL